jgi:hypothetical protein
LKVLAPLQTNALRVKEDLFRDKWRNHLIAPLP